MQQNVLKKALQAKQLKNLYFAGEKMKKLAYLYVISAAALWGFIGVFFKALSDIGFTNMQVVAVRVIAAALFLLLYVVKKDISLLKIKLADSWCFAGTGIVSLLFFNWCYFTAIEKTGLAVAAVLLYTAPIFVMLMSAMLFGERLNRQKLAAVAITFLGCVLVTGILNSGAQFSAAGIAAGICSGIGYALYSIFGRFALNKGYSSVTVTAYTFIFAAAATLPVSKLWQVHSLLLRLDTLLFALGIGIVCCLFPYILYTSGLSKIDTGKASVIATVEPAVAAAISFVFYHEPVTVSKLSGIILIISAIIMINLKPKAAK